MLIGFHPQPLGELTFQQRVSLFYEYNYVSASIMVRSTW
jgi:hypothetical protein